MKKAIFLIFTLFAIGFVKAQWKSTSGPYLASDFIGMYVSKIAVSGDNLCAIIDFNVYTSNNNGASWMYASYGMEDKGLRSIAFKDSNIFVGTSVGIYLSTNYGSSYTSINNNLPINSRVDAILIRDNQLVATILSDYPSYIMDVYYSTDKGANWHPTNGLKDKYAKCLASDGTNVYAGTSSGVFMSSDNGLNWVNIGLSNEDISVIAVKGSRIFASENNSSGGFYFSNDNGINWTSINNGFAYPEVGSIAITENYVYATNSNKGVYRSSNNGSNWSYITNGLSNCSGINAVAVNGANVYAGYSDNLAVSTDEGLSWSAGLKTYNLNIASIVSSSANILSATYNGIQKSFDNGVSWVRDLVNINTLAVNNSIVFAGGNAGMLISTNYGNTWSGQNIYGLPSNPKFSSIFVNDSIAFASSFGKGIYCSKDNGKNWTQRINGISNLSINGLTIADTVIFAGSNNNGVYVSYDNGLNWHLANSGLTDSCIQSLASYNNIIYAGTKSHGIFKSIDNGSNWIQVYNSKSDTSVLCLYTCGVNVLAGILGKGLLLSPDNGITWTAYNTGLMNYNIQTITENGTDFYIGTKGSLNNGSTSGGGVWKRAMKELPLTLSFKKIKVSDKVICEGYSSSIEAFAIGGTPPYKFLWNIGDTTSKIKVSPIATSTYNVSVIDGHNDLISTDITITVKPKPAKPIISQVGDTLISSANSGNVWLLNNETIYQSNSNIFVPPYAGNYSVFTIQEGCISETSNIIYMDNRECLPENDIEIYPNPVLDKITIITSNEINLTIIDFCGNELIHQEIEEPKSQIDISKLTSGVYFVKLTLNKTVIIKKIFKK